jgi:hypothetical protein
MPKSTKALIEEWYTRCSRVAVGHYKMADRYSKKHTRLSVSTAILSALIGTTVFTTLQNQNDSAIKITIGLLSILASILSALSAFMGYQDKAQKHRTAGSKYNSVGRELEQISIQPLTSSETLSLVRSRLDILAEESPHLPRSVHIEIADLSAITKWGKSISSN